jgi:hypothetical protein
MPRIAKDIRQHRFNLNYNLPDQAALHDYLQQLAQTGDASDWIISALKKEYIASTQQVHDEYIVGTKNVLIPAAEPDEPKANGLPHPLTTNEIIAQRKDAAAKKFQRSK